MNPNADWAAEWSAELRSKSQCVLCEKPIKTDDRVRIGTFGLMSGEMHEVGCWTNYHQVKNRPAFSGLDRTCPKCRGHVDTEWFRLGWKNDLLGLPTESLERKCCRCGYTWRELTAEDSEGRDNAS